MTSGLPSPGQPRAHDRMRRGLGTCSGWGAAWSLGLVLLSGLPGCAPARGQGARTDTLTIGAYSVVREAFREGILPAFAQFWKDRTGRLVRFEESYNGSGAQSRAIASGFDADVAVLSLEGDVDRLVVAGLVRKDWKSGPTQGIITRSLVVIGVRAGNPRRIEDWGDLARPGVGVLYPDPKTSGGARWNINAIYGAGLLARRFRGGVPDPEAGRDLLAAVQAHVVNMDSSGRQSMATFERGTGDAIVTYENELLLQRQRTGAEAPYIIPPATLLIEGPAVVVDASVERHGNRALAEALLDFLRCDEGQRILSRYGFRPLDSPRATTVLAARTEPRPPQDARGEERTGRASLRASPFSQGEGDRKPLPAHLFTMADLGGWSRVNKTIYGPGGVWDALFTARRLARKQER